MQRQHPGTHANNSGWVTTRQAAAALGVNPRRVRTYISDGDLVAKIEGDGASKRYLVSVASLEELRRKLRVYRGTDHPHVAQQPTVLDLKLTSKPK